MGRLTTCFQNRIAAVDSSTSCQTLAEAATGNAAHCSLEDAGAARRLHAGLLMTAAAQDMTSMDAPGLRELAGLQLVLHYPYHRMHTQPADLQGPWAAAAEATVCVTPHSSQSCLQGRRRAPQQRGAAARLCGAPRPGCESAGPGGPCSDAPGRQPLSRRAAAAAAAAAERRRRLLPQPSTVPSCGRRWQQPPPCGERWGALTGCGAAVWPQQPR